MSLCIFTGQWLFEFVNCIVVNAVVDIADSFVLSEIRMIFLCLIYLDLKLDPFTFDAHVLCRGYFSVQSHIPHWNWLLWVGIMWGSSKRFIILWSFPKCSIIFKLTCKLRKATVCFFMSVCVSVCAHPQGTAQLPLDRFWWNLIFEYFLKMCPGKSSLIKCDKNNRYFTCGPLYIFDNTSLNCC
jgi:hypothetical protein